MSTNLVIKLIQPPAGVSSAELPVAVNRSSTVAELKDQIAARVSIPRDHIRLVCVGRIWADTSTVESYEPKDGTVVHCLNNPPRNLPSSSQQVLTPADPMQQMMGGGAAAGGLGGMHRLMMSNPDMMRQIMELPMVQQMFSNPDMIRQMLRMHPQMNQLMETHPEISRLLEDPDHLQQIRQMIANPSLFREMTRNADRVMGQLDTIPGGHDALVRAHHDIADPLFEALSGGRGGQATSNMQESRGRSRSRSRAQHRVGGAPNSEALPNPWGPRTPASSSATAGAASPASAAAQTSVSTTTATTTAAPNPMASMIQQMMSDPALMQQTMQMMSTMMGGNRGTQVASVGGQISNASTSPSLPRGTPTSTPGAHQPNLFAEMMAHRQQMMANFANAAPVASVGVTPPATPAATHATTPAALTPTLRTRFASQLTQLTSMGFTDESGCIQALVQHNGRIDAAIDTLLAKDSSSA